MWQTYLCAESIDDALSALATSPRDSRIIAGGTDLILELERRTRQGIKNLIDITRIPGLRTINQGSDGNIHLGPLVTHNDCATSPIIRKYALPLAQAAWSVGSPQIRNRGTIAGNLITASPANDTITPLIALDSRLVLQSKARGKHEVRLHDFYAGVRRTILEPDEMVVEIIIPPLLEGEKGLFFKQALRQAQAISVVNIAIVLKLTTEGVLEKVRITLGSVAPTIIRALEAEAFLIGKKLTEGTINRAGQLIANASKPINDIRGSAEYRRYMTGVIGRRSLAKLAAESSQDSLPKNPVRLDTGTETEPSARIFFDKTVPIITKINGKVHTFTTGQGKTLLALLRDEGNLVGTKEGCSEGECGACTVFLDGMAVMSCLVPSPRAHGAEIITIEGLVNNNQLHPIQSAFIKTGAVQCGYCTPGLIMSAAKLLEEVPSPDKSQVKQAITGNLCRCTGYYSILQAIEMAAGGNLP